MTPPFRRLRQGKKVPDMSIPKWLVFDDINGNLGRTWEFAEDERCRAFAAIVGLPDEPPAKLVTYERIDRDQSIRRLMAPDPRDEKYATTILYRNHRGEVSERRIAPAYSFYGSTEHHLNPQWFLQVFDFDRQAERSFAMRDILSWDPT